MAETKTAKPVKANNEVTADRTRDFWTRNSRMIMIIGVSLLLLIGGYFAYKNLIQEPKETKASEAIFKAEEYFRADSLQLALNGDGRNPGFLKIISQYGGTRAGNLARYYAGAIYLQMGDAAKAVKHLDGFETDARQIQARAYKLLGDAQAEQGKNKEALANYKKAARHFDSDEMNASEYLFTAAYFAEQVGGDKNGAIEMYRELKSKYPNTRRGFEVDKYLARLGVYSDTK